MPPTAQEGDATRARLLDATAGTIVECGWGGVSTRVVAERAGVKPGVVHYHFGSVDELRRRAGLHALQAMIEPFLAVAVDMSPRQVVEAVAEASVQEYAPGTDESTLVYEVMLATARDPQLAEELHHLLRRFRTVLADGIRRWHPTPAASPDVLAELVSAAIDGLQLHLLVEPDLDLAGHLAPLLELLGPEVAP